VVKIGRTPVLSVEETRELLDSMDTDSLIDLRDRALIGLMVYTFARVGALTKMREDVYVKGRRTWVRLHEKGGKRHEMPCHYNLEHYLEAYIEGGGNCPNAKGYLFRTARGPTLFVARQRLVYNAQFLALLRQSIFGIGTSGQRLYDTGSAISFVITSENGSLLLLRCVVGTTQLGNSNESFIRQSL